jgi:hypothetical protein
MYDLSKSRDSFLKFGFAIASIEFSRLREVSVPALGLGNFKLDQFGIRVIGAVMFSYLAARWGLALIHYYKTQRVADAKPVDARKSFSEIVEGLKPMGWLDLATLGFEIGAPAALVAWYAYLVYLRAG